ncbi:contractile injection system tape measure protein [Roseobacter sp. S98]|uniref:contractile injection system tape measure protein n=1 Tax=Roseobacter algicola (ex Choi et al. 2025) (nom. illeg.) TaxID=3092138 RepID=UPI003F518FE0
MQTAARISRAPQEAATIETLAAEIAVTAADGPLSSPERLLAAVRNEILPALSQVLERAPWTNAGISVPALEIDLGDWPDDPVWSEVRWLLAQRLEAALTPYLEEAQRRAERAKLSPDKAVAQRSEEPVSVPRTAANRTGSGDLPAPTWDDDRHRQQFLKAREFFSWVQQFEGAPDGKTIRLRLEKNLAEARALLDLRSAGLAPLATDPDLNARLTDALAALAPAQTDDPQVYRNGTPAEEERDADGDRHSVHEHLHSDIHLDRLIDSASGIKELLLRMAGREAHPNDIGTLSASGANVLSDHEWQAVTHPDRLAALEQVQTRLINALIHQGAPADSARKRAMRLLAQVATLPRSAADNTTGGQDAARATTYPTDTSGSITPAGGPVSANYAAISPEEDDRFGTAVPRGSDRSRQPTERGILQKAAGANTVSASDRAGTDTAQFSARSDDQTRDAQKYPQPTVQGSMSGADPIPANAGTAQPPDPVAVFTDPAADPAALLRGDWLDGDALRALHQEVPQDLSRAFSRLSASDLLAIAHRLIPRDAVLLQNRLDDLRRDAQHPERALQQAVSALLRGSPLDFEALLAPADEENTETASTTDDSAIRPSGPGAGNDMLPEEPVFRANPPTIEDPVADLLAASGLTRAEIHRVMRTAPAEFSEGERGGGPATHLPMPGATDTAGETGDAPMHTQATGQSHADAVNDRPDVVSDKTRYPVQETLEKPDSTQKKTQTDTSAGSDGDGSNPQKDTHAYVFSSKTGRDQKASQDAQTAPADAGQNSIGQGDRTRAVPDHPDEDTKAETADLHDKTAAPGSGSSNPDQPPQIITDATAEPRTPRTPDATGHADEPPLDGTHRSQRYGREKTPVRDDAGLLLHLERVTRATLPASDSDLAAALRLVNALWPARDPDRPQTQFPLMQALLQNAVSAPLPGQSLARRLGGLLEHLEPDENRRVLAMRTVSARLSAPAGPDATRLRQQTRAALENLLAGDTDADNDVRDTQAKAPVVAAPDDETETLLVSETAGLVLLHPFYPLLFERTSVPRDGRALAPEGLPLARGLLMALSGTTETPMPDPLHQILLGVDPAAPLPDPQQPDEAAMELMDGLLRSVISRWARLGATSPDGLRETFLRRTGTLRTDSTGTHLRVTPGPFDMLLDSLPWSPGPVTLPWMPLPCHVIWREETDE